MKIGFDVQPPTLGCSTVLQLTSEELVILLQNGEKFPETLKVELTDIEMPITPEDVASVVIPVMMEMPELAHLPVSELKNIPLGMLRRDNVRCFGKCRIKNGPNRSQRGPKDVRRIDLSQTILTPEWVRIAAATLYHEYLHALGFLRHDSEFRALERLWPDEEARGGTPTEAKKHSLRKTYFETVTEPQAIADMQAFESR